MINQGIGKRWDSYQPTKALAAWLCVISVAATMIVGFGWGGWVRGSTAQDVATKAASGARAELAAAVCVHQFVAGTDATTRLASLRGTESWKRDTFIEEGGWVTLAGADKPVAGAAGLCSQTLMDLPVKAAATAG